MTPHCIGEKSLSLSLSLLFIRKESAYSLYTESRHFLLAIESGSHSPLRREGVCILFIYKGGTLSSSFIEKESASSLNRRERGDTLSPLRREGDCLLYKESRHSLLFLEKESASSL